MRCTSGRSPRGAGAGPSGRSRSRSKRWRIEPPVPLVGRALYLTYVQNAGPLRAARGRRLPGGDRRPGGGLYRRLLGLLGRAWRGQSLARRRPGAATGRGHEQYNWAAFRLGYVVDFIDFRVWPVFNVADDAIAVSARASASITSAAGARRRTTAGQRGPPATGRWSCGCRRRRRSYKRIRPRSV